MILLLLLLLLLFTSGEIRPVKRKLMIKPYPKISLMEPWKNTIKPLKKQIERRAGL